MDEQKSSVTTSAAPSNRSTHKTAKNVSALKVNNENALKRFVNGAGKIARKVSKFAFDHKEEIIGVAVTVGTAIWAAVSSSDGNSSGNSDSDSDDSCGYYPPTNDDYTYTETPSSVERSSPREHEVPRHSQRYHTKDGVVIREKEPYHRGGKKEEQ